MTYDEFLEQFKPIPNHLEESSFDGYFFETYGEEEELVLAQTNETVWTIVETEKGLSLINGRHFVNRFGYFITAIPWDTDYEIKID